MRLPGPLTDEGVAGLRAILDGPQQSLLAFDFDGVLSPIVDDPEQSRAHPEVVPALRDLAGVVGSVAIITGRPAADVIRLGGFGDLVRDARLTVFGSYGQERWDARRNAVVAPEVAPGVAAVRAELPGILRDLGAPPGVAIEDKGRSLAVHTRRAAEAAWWFTRLRDPLAALAGRHDLVLEPGRFVLELRPPGTDKGRVLTQHVKDQGIGAVAYFGDDLGDIPAFKAVEVLRQSNIPGLKVCSGSDEAAEISRLADLTVDGPPGVVAFLTGLSEMLEGSDAQAQ